MIRIIVVILLLDLLLAGCQSFENIRESGNSSQPPAPITVMTYNIRIGAGVQNWNRSPYKLKDEVTLNLNPIANAIRSINPDIVGLQEVLGISQAAYLGKTLNMNYAYVPHGLSGSGGWWGVALLSKYRILDVIRQEISWGPGNSKSILIAILDISGRQIAVSVIHKDHDLYDGASFHNIKKATDRLNMPMLLVGDFNIKPHDERHHILEDRFLDSATQADTQSARFVRELGTRLDSSLQGTGKRIDYVLVERDRFRVLDSGTLANDHWEASDHLAYYARLRLL